MSYVFISYSHLDSEYAQKLAKELERRGIPIWIDERIDYGTQWPHVIEEHLDNCAALIVIMTTSAHKSNWVHNELNRATRKAKPVFPLLLQGKEPWLSVESTQYVDVRDGKLPPDSFYIHLNRQIKIRQFEYSPPQPQYSFFVEDEEIFSQENGSIIADTLTQQNDTSEIYETIQPQVKRKRLWLKALILGVVFGGGFGFLGTFNIYQNPSAAIWGTMTIMFSLLGFPIAYLILFLQTPRIAKLLSRTGSVLGLLMSIAMWLSPSVTKSNSAAEMPHMMLSITLIFYLIGWAIGRIIDGAVWITAKLKESFSS